MGHFTIKSLSVQNITTSTIVWENEFSPMNTDFYSFAANNGIGVCPTLVPEFTLVFDENKVCIGIEAYLNTYWGYKDGIAQHKPDRLDEVFRKYMSEKGYSNDVFNINTKEKATLFLKNLTSPM